MKFSVFQVSRKGGREKNEDRMGYCYTRESGLFVLADGMGGHPEGEVAAQMALQAIAALYQKEARPTVKNAIDFLSTSLLSAHYQLLRYANDKGMRDTPRTTLVTALVQGSQVSWVHCGDSRLYLVRNGALHTRTRDHSCLEQQSQGMAPPKVVNRNALFTCLGSPLKPIFEIVSSVNLQRGDRILLCSDGLWGSLTDDEIVRHLCVSSLSDAVPEMVEHALYKGGKRSDNVTALAFEWETPGANESSHSISTDTIREGVFASTIQANVFDTAADDLDDAAIERSIAEINEAIRRATTKRS